MHDIILIVMTKVIKKWKAEQSTADTFRNRQITLFGAKIFFQKAIDAKTNNERLRKPLCFSNNLSAHYDDLDPANKNIKTYDNRNRNHREYRQPQIACVFIFLQAIVISGINIFSDEHQFFQHTPAVHTKRLSKFHLEHKKSPHRPRSIYQFLPRKTADGLFLCHG